jgi:hypothetical protein
MRTGTRKRTTKAVVRPSAEQAIRQEIEADRQQCQVGMGTIHAKLKHLEARQADTDDAGVMLTKLTSYDPQERMSGFFHKLRRTLQAQG